MSFRLGEIAAWVHGAVVGDETREIEAVRTVEAAGPSDLSFLTNPRYRKRAEASAAGALLVGLEIEIRGHDLVRCADPYFALHIVLERFYPRAVPPPGMHETAVVANDATVASTAHVGPYCVIGSGAAVGDGAVLHAHVVIGRDCQVGEGAELHSHVVLYDGTLVGPRVIVHSGVVLGSDGYGFATHGGEHHKIPQVGRAVIEEDVEIGANTTIDRAMLGETRIGAGTKIDNLVQVGHNVRVGSRSLLVSQSGISGSTVLGSGVVVAGQSGLSGHLEIGDGVQIAAKSAVFKSVEAGQRLAGIPAVEMGQWRRQQALIRRLAELERRVRELEGKASNGDRE